MRVVSPAIGPKMTVTTTPLSDRSNGFTQYHISYLPLSDDGDFDLRLEYRRNVMQGHNDKGAFVMCLQLTDKGGEEDPDNPERTVLLTPDEARAVAFWLLDAAEPGGWVDPGDVKGHLAELDEVDEVLR